MAQTFGRLGISAGTQVVLYDQDNGLYASRMWWMLRYMGHEAAAVLDGGWAKWTREGRPVAQRRGDTSAPPRSRDGRATAPACAWTRWNGWSAIRRTLLVDARAPERFEGRNEPLDRPPGHIPGAVNHFYKWNVRPTARCCRRSRCASSSSRSLARQPPASRS